MQNRLVYVDWMKAIGMFLIIWGHFFPPHLSKYIYAISVPLFLFVSGYLNKETSNRFEWWKKQWHSLILPYLILCAANIAISWLINGMDSLRVIFYRFYLCLLGFNCRNGVNGCEVLWFVYTLFIIRFIENRTPVKYKLFVAIVMLALGWEIGKRTFHYLDYWAVQAVPICYPIYALGTYMRRINVVSRCSPPICEIIILSLSCTLFYFAVRGNGNAFLFNAEYGKNYFRFLLGVLSGVAAIGVISLRLNTVSLMIVAIISTGTFFIMALHGYMIYLCKLLIWPIIDNDQVKYFVFSLMILLAFVPIIIIAEKFFPCVLGKRKVIHEQ